MQTWPDWDPLGGLGVDDITEAGVATALAFLGIFLWLAAIGHVLVYLARAASLLVLVATGPLAAAGLVSDFTRSWFWKSLRWFHAAAFTPVLMVMVLGIGVQFANASLPTSQTAPPRRSARPCGGHDDPDQRRRAAGAVQASGLRRPPAPPAARRSGRAWPSRAASRGC
ncbi:type IV secretion system protein [Nocardioides dokdonensis]|uniref:type IV secretion system protein n=1 Tax=Nocardioides dokdonensis TaxID=450734 RepID=UPI000B2C2347|nr:type IV secretion system protein [Nocardioides dokdonensis]